MTRVLIADDHAVVRRGLSGIINDTIDLTVVGEASSGPELLDLIGQTEADVVVLDLNMPGPSGLDTLAQIHALRPKLPVLVLSVHDEDMYALRVIRAGAAGYLSKESAPELLVRAIRRVAGGGRYVSPTVAEVLLDRLDAGVEGPAHEALSDREFQVLRLLAQGHSITEIGEMLSLSVKTVSTYRSRVLDKMRLKSNADLTRYALEHRIIV